MGSSAEREVVLTHALANEDNLAVALLIGTSFGELCGRVIARFLGNLEAELAHRLGNRWEVTATRDTDQIAANWCELVTCRYLDHPGGFCVGLIGEGEKYPKYPYFAVWHAQG